MGHIEKAKHIISKYILEYTKYQHFKNEKPSVSNVIVSCARLFVHKSSLSSVMMPRECGILTRCHDEKVLSSHGTPWYSSPHSAPKIV